MTNTFSSNSFFCKYCHKDLFYHSQIDLLICKKKLKDIKGTLDYWT